MIEFTIVNTTYEAEEGMTWAEWVESEYNTGNIYLWGFPDGTTLGYGYGGDISLVYLGTPLQMQTKTDTIVDGAYYSLMHSGGGSND